MKLTDILNEVTKLNEAFVYKVSNPKLDQDKTYYYASNSTQGRAKAQLLANNNALGKFLKASGEATTLDRVDQQFPDMASANQWIADNQGSKVSNVGSAANVGIEKVFALLRNFYGQKSSVLKRTGGTSDPTEREKNVKWYVAASDIDKTVKNLQELLRDYNDALRTQKAGGSLDDKEQQLVKLSDDDVAAVEKYASNFKKYVDMKNGFKKQATPQSPEQVYYPIQTRLVASIPSPRAAQEDEPTDEYDPFAEPGEGEGENEPEVDNVPDFKDLGNFIKKVGPGIVSTIAKTEDPATKLNMIEKNLRKLEFWQLKGLADIQRDEKVKRAIENLIDKKEQDTMARGKNKNKKPQEPQVSKGIRNIFKDLENQPDDFNSDGMSIKGSVKESLKESADLLKQAKKFFSR